MSSKSLYFSRFSRGRRLPLFAGLVLLGVLGCGGGTTDPDLDPDPDVDLEYDPSFMVGDWLAESMVVTSVANTEVIADLVALGATFRFPSNLQAVTPPFWRGTASPAVKAGDSQSTDPRWSSCHWWALQSGPLGSEWTTP